MRLPVARLALREHSDIPVALGQPGFAGATSSRGASGHFALGVTDETGNIVNRENQWRFAAFLRPQ